MGFTEIADRVWVDRQEWLDLNVVLVEGTAGLALVDTTGSVRTAHRLRDDVRRISPTAPLLALVNTHDHWDHTWGNGVLAGDAAAIISHEQAKVPATREFSSVTAVDLGDRYLELVHPGRGHTGGDLVVQVPDAEVLLAGDLVEESAPPAFGSDCFPLEWAASLDVVLSLLTPATTVVPGHGAPVDRAFVEHQRADIAGVAETIRELAGHGIAASRALEATEWPFPRELLTDAVVRGYSHLPRGARRLPLVDNA